MEAQQKRRLKAARKAAEKRGKAAAKAKLRNESKKWRYHQIGNGYCTKFIWASVGARSPKCNYGDPIANRYCRKPGVRTTDPFNRKQTGSWTIKGCMKYCAAWRGATTWGKNAGTRRINSGFWNGRYNQYVGHQFFIGYFGRKQGNACGCCAKGSRGVRNATFGACKTYRMDSYPGMRL